LSIHLFKKIRRAVHREIVDPFLLHLFSKREDAICAVYNSEPVTPERVVSNFMQGMILSGKDKKEKMYWFRKDDLYWQIYTKRTVITDETAYISKRLRRYLRNSTFQIKNNTDFEKVIRSCQRENETWISESLVQIYKLLHDQGFVQTVEVYDGTDLVGGLWGLVVGKTFSAMSVFHTADKAGSIAFASLVQRIEQGEFTMLDTGLTNLWDSFGAKTIAHNEFMKNVIDGLRDNTPAVEGTDES